MTNPRLTAEQEHAYLIDREEHRKPVDAHFQRAIQEMAQDLDAEPLELGPGPMDDLRAHMARLGIPVIQADTRPAHEGVTPLEPLWTREQRLPWPSGRFTDVLAREVFEHVYHLREMLAEVHRILTPGGTLWFSTPFAFPYHDIEPENGGDFWRATAICWDRMLTDAGFSSVEVTEARFLFGSWQLPINLLGRAIK